MSRRKYFVNGVVMAEAGGTTTSQATGDNLQYQESDFVPFARQQSLLINLLDEFKRVMAPLDDDFVDLLISKCVLRVEERAEVCDPFCTNRDRVYRLWDRLKRVPPSTFFRIVVPLLQMVYPQLAPLTMPEDEDLPEMCLRDVVLNVVHFDDIADDLLKNRVIKIIDHGDTNRDGPLTKKWAHLLNIVKKKAKSSKCEMLSKIFAEHLAKYEISVPPDLSYRLSCGLPCTCSDEVDGNDYSKHKGLRSLLLCCFKSTGHKKSTKRTPGPRQQSHQEEYVGPEGLGRSLAPDGLTTSTAGIPNGRTLTSSSSLSSQIATARNDNGFWWEQPSTSQEPHPSVVYDDSPQALLAKYYRSLSVRNLSMSSTSTLSERDLEFHSRTMSASSHFSGSSAVYGTERTNQLEWTQSVQEPTACSFYISDTSDSSSARL